MTGKWPKCRLKRKTPVSDVDWDATENLVTFEIMTMRRQLTRRGLEKRQEKELRWSEISPELHGKFREAESKQWFKHIEYDALEPLDEDQTAKVLASTAKKRVLRSRWAYRDKNWVSDKPRRTPAGFANRGQGGSVESVGRRHTVRLPDRELSEQREGAIHPPTFYWSAQHKPG